MGIPKLEKWLDFEFEASEKVTEKLKALIIRQDFDTHINATKVDEKLLREKKRRRNKENKNCSQCVRLSSHTSVNLCSLGAIGQQCSRRENAGPFMKIF